MTATDDMIGIIPPIVVAGAVTKMASTMFPSNEKTKTRTRTVYKTKYVTRKAKSKKKTTSKKNTRKSKGSWVKGSKKSVYKYL